MSRDPEDEIRIVVEDGDQRGIGRGDKYRHARSVIDEVRLRVDRDMGRDNHELVFVLPLLEFTFEPVDPGLVETTGGIIRLDLSLAGIIEGDNLDRYIRLRLEAIRGKVVVHVGLGETVTNRVRSRGKKFAHPILAGGSGGRE